MAKFIDSTNLGYLISKIKAAFWPKTDVTNVTLADVAVTGDYDDLINKPSGGDCNVFPVTVTYMMGGSYSISESISDIQDAVDAGKVVILTVVSPGDVIMYQLPLSNANYNFEVEEGVFETGLLFAGFYEATANTLEFIGYVLYNDGNDDLVNEIMPYYDFSLNESTWNKVTSLSSSSTDTQYPSAKCVYDLVGDVETLINAL